MESNSKGWGYRELDTPSKIRWMDRSTVTSYPASINALQVVGVTRWCISQLLPLHCRWAEATHRQTVPQRASSQRATKSFVQPF